jgi:anti-anti-sigma factor
MADDATLGFDVSSTREDGIVRVAVRGDVDTATAGELERALLGQVADAATLHVDLGEVSFMDSSGLRALIVARQATLEADGTFGIVATTPAVDRLLRLTGLEELLC